MLGLKISKIELLNYFFSLLLYFLYQFVLNLENFEDKLSMPLGPFLKNVGKRTQLNVFADDVRLRAVVAILLSTIQCI